MALKLRGVRRRSPVPLDRKGVSTMADLTVRTLKDLTEKLPDNCILTCRIKTNGEFGTVPVGLIAYTQDNELIFLPEPDV